MSECIYDQGGYFVVNGSEKVLIAQERRANNMVLTSQSHLMTYRLPFSSGVCIQTPSAWPDPHGRNCVVH
jgi:DNA-directed RNA polymerase beta subunit